MENNGNIKEKKISKRKMFTRMLRLFLWSIRKRTWFLPDLDEITVDELFDRINSGQPPLLIDTRDKKAYNGTGDYSYEQMGHIPNSRQIFVSELPTKFEELQPFKDKEIVTLCPGGGMSLVAVDVLVEAGFSDVKSLKGGIRAWKKKGYPLIKGESTL
ncbi:MAG: rhodanese-like domain-containing protein [Candidatus Hodarchaeales archaeon]|jgi:rhodanese-related sulfurtransferase